MIYKTIELTGALLDAAVAKANGWHQSNGDYVYMVEDEKSTRLMGISIDGYKPSSDWSIGGPIIDRECISIISSGRDFHEAYVNLNTDHGELAERDAYANGPTAIIAAMRAYVAHKLGDEVEL